MMTSDEMASLADEIEASNGLIIMLPGPRFGTEQIGIRKTAAVVAMLRDRRKYSLLESQFSNCHQEIRRLREALLSLSPSQLETPDTNR
jgi:hypothetical protein